VNRRGDDLDLSQLCNARVNVVRREVGPVSAMPASCIAAVAASGRKQARRSVTQDMF